MEYKRLTNNNLDEYNPEYDFCVGCEHFGEPNGCNRSNGTCGNYERFMETYNRLAELEDKIEQGTLIELPCKVGDTVYQVEGEHYPIFKEYEIGGVAIVGNAGLESIKLLDDCHCDGFFAWASKIGETVFLTRKEAEKRLKELQE